MFNIKNKSLKDLVAKKKTKVLEFPTHKDFKLTCVYLSPAAFQEAQLNASLDDNVDMQKALLHEIVRGWEGLTLDILTDLVVLNGYTKEDFEDEELASEIEFNDEHLDLLYDSSDAFYTWVNKVVTDSATFRS